jgi:acyl-CoA dehydrogenase
MYQPPVEAIASALARFTGAGEDVAGAVVAEAGRFAGGAIAPLATVGDRDGAKLAGGVVTMPEGWAALYRRWREGGWNGLSAPEEWGGQGLPLALGMAVAEIWNGASMAFGLAPLLTSGAIEALAAHASPPLQALYLPKLVSGEWTGTMNLTEPQAGSDVGALAARAEPAGEGRFRIFGQKIYITYGEHDLAENIVHLVLARLPGAPAGSRGISLFLVPKFLPNAEGRPGTRNDVLCAGIERKLGLHASPTCTMLYGSGAFGGEAGALGWLVGEENRGLNCMFTMMNNARLAVGIQGVAVAEAATQKALAYAAERRQGRAAGFKGEGSAPIIHHRDVQRALLTMKALTAAARAICYACADAIDRSRGADDAAFWTGRADLLTPVAKAFATDVGVDVASTGIQVHGGMGFIEDTGAAVLLRDARIAPIYEGTNGIQAIDLVSRKLPAEGGRTLQALLGEMDAVAQAVRASNDPGFGTTAERLDRALGHCREAAEFLLSAAPDAALSGATPFLRLAALAVGGSLLASQALQSRDAAETALCRFFAENLLDEAGALASRATQGGESLAIAAEAILPLS